MTQWLSQFTRNTHDPYGFGYACAYSNGRPTPISGHRGLIHSTEGSSLPNYQGGKVNPNFTVDPWRKRRYQHVPADIASRATMANNDKFVQIEIIGFCDLAYAKRYGMEAYYLERMGADELAYIAESLAIIGAARGVPIHSTVTWEAYPKSAWADNTVRLSQAQLNGYSGWLGHQHTPKPDIHGDPGQWPYTMDLWSVMRGAKPGPAPKPSPPAPTKPTYYIGANVQKAWAKDLGTTADGVISSQDAGQKGCFHVDLWPCIQWAAAGQAKGSRLIAAFQRKHGLKPDGIIGPKTMRAIQAWAGLNGKDVDGVGGPVTTKAVCRKLGFK